MVTYSYLRSNCSLSCFRLSPFFSTRNPRRVLRWLLTARRKTTQIAYDSRILNTVLKVVITSPWVVLTLLCHSPRSCAYLPMHLEYGGPQHQGREHVPCPSPGYPCAPWLAGLGACSPNGFKSQFRSLTGRLSVPTPPVWVTTWKLIPLPSSS